MNLEHQIAELVLAGLAEQIDRKLDHRFAILNQKLDSIMASESELAASVVQQTQDIRDAVSAAAQRILDRITEAVAASDVSPALTAALAAGQADIDAINALAPAPTPPPVA